ncbi:MAG: hypothetical protein NT045_05410, partial [Candidatus Aureabacteria bacterium]|nr:hypothetical protein [Candidatus Auribacterota bacterium]
MSIADNVARVRERMRAAAAQAGRDPLGVELLLHGTVRGIAATWPDGRPVAALDSLASGPGVAID